MPVVTIREAEEKLLGINERIHIYNRVINEHFSAREIVETQGAEEISKPEVTIASENETPVIIQPPLSIPKIDALMDRIEKLHDVESRIRTALERFKAIQTFEY